MRAKRFLSWLTSATLVTGLLVATGPTAPAESADLARGKPVSTSSGHATAATITDGNQETYWEGAASGEQWAQVDLGATTRLDRAVLELPAKWRARTQHVSVQASTDGATFATASGATAKTFEPDADNTVTVPLGEVQARFVKIGFVGSAQLSSLEVYAAPGRHQEPRRRRAVPHREQQHRALRRGQRGRRQRATYWESANNAFPQWIQADLGSSVATNRVVLKLPAGWGPARRRSSSGTARTAAPSPTSSPRPATGSTRPPATR